ncbi:hypothetical protein D5078_13835 [Pectobacterium carotovorum]|uniref:hypothetical protein n=1 Tax=Pectobacterium carotovorum TaxID=554 RepID=UPI000E7673CE|nr:hypothetical protein [Pectobacterium carotovorum]RJL44584.1 hypothetical protein D5078_13835 [Pectobacterium carotovorum]
MENKKIVIDADILRSSSEKEHPISSASRKVLNAVLDSTCFAVVNKELYSEWKKHASKIAVGWRASMESKGKIIRCTEDNFYYSIVHDSDLDENLRFIALKDSHLVTLAISHDRIVTSNDDRARKAFCNLCCERTELGKIFWVNVKSNSDEIINVLGDKYQTLNDEHRLSSIE